DATESWPLWVTAFAAALAMASSLGTLMPGVAVRSPPAAVVPVPLVVLLSLLLLPQPAPRATAASAARVASAISRNLIPWIPLPCCWECAPGTDLIHERDCPDISHEYFTF